MQGNLRVKLYIYTYMYLQMLLECQLAWALDPFPEEPIPILDHPLHVELFPNTQPELPLRQLDAIPSPPVARQQQQRGQMSPFLRQL